MRRLLRAPDPPDVDPEASAATELGDLCDAVVVRADWAGRRALRASFRRVEMRLCRLTGADLGEASLADVTLEDCHLDLVGLRFARLERVVLRDCRMSECDLSGAALEDVLIERCDLRGASLDGARMERVELRACELEGLSGAAALRGVSMPWSDVVQNAPVFASALGIDVLPDDG